MYIHVPSDISAAKQLLIKIRASNPTFLYKRIFQHPTEITELITKLDLIAKGEADQHIQEEVRRKCQLLKSRVSYWLTRLLYGQPTVSQKDIADFLTSENIRLKLYDQLKFFFVSLSAIEQLCCKAK